MIMNKLYRCTLVSVMLMLMVLCAHAQERQVTGTVKDASGQPLPGVNILVKGTTNGTTTDADGKFSLGARSEDVLLFSFIGYTTQEVAVGNQTSMAISMTEDLTTLGEVVVVGYGEQKKALNTGANLQVKGEDLQKLSTTNALQALQGQAAGVQITSTSGQPGEAMRVVIRGMGTIYGANPLYVVDGVITSDINFLNPADIQSIDVLKDAASAAIYGAQAANGVVLITTKKGRKGANAQITFDAYYGIQNVARKTPMLNAKEYAVLMNEAAVNSGKAPYFNEAQVDAIANGDTNWESAGVGVGLSAEQIQLMKGGTNWLNQMFVKDAPTSNYVFGVTGGSDASTYSASLSYLSQEGIVGGADLSNYERYNFRFNSEHKLYNDMVRFGQNLNFAYVENNGIMVGGQYNNSLRSAFNTSPFLPMYDENGDFWDASYSRWSKGEANPYAQMYYSNQNRRNSQRLIGNVYAEVEPIKNLKFRSSVGIDYYAGEGHSYTPVYQLSIYSFNDTTKVSQDMNKGRTILWDNLLSYGFDHAGDHHFDVMVGSSMYQGRGNWISGSNVNLSMASLDNAWLSNALNRSKASYMNLDGAPIPDDNRMSYFARVHYNLRETYLLNATVRADGSSRFAKGNRWGYFPSVSAGWVLTNENFMSGLTNIVDQFKLRASWGQVGNMNIDFFQYIAPITFDGTNYTFGTTEGSLTPGAFPIRLANPGLKWETSIQKNIGFDATLLGGHLTATVDWYNKTNKDWLVVAPVLATAGALPPFINGGKVTNKGIEVSLAYNGELSDLRYKVGGNVAYNKNVVNDIPTADGIIHGSANVLYDNSGEFNRVQAGMPVGYFWGWRTAGIFQNEDEVKSYTNDEGDLLQPAAKPGDVRYVDTDGNGVLNADDKVMIGNPNPKFVFGFNVQLGYKGFDFSILANGVAGNKIVQSYRNQANAFGNYTRAMLDRWHGEGTSNSLPRVNESNSNWVEFSDLFIRDGDFLRISNITAGYDFAKLLKFKSISQLRLYASGLNLFTFTKYSGMDPEVGHGYNQWTSGVDLGYYPRPRTIMMGLNVKF